MTRWSVVTKPHALDDTREDLPSASCGSTSSAPEETPFGRFSPFRRTNVEEPTASGARPVRLYPTQTPIGETFQRLYHTVYRTYHCSRYISHIIFFPIFLK